MDIEIVVGCGAIGLWLIFDGVTRISRGSASGRSGLLLAEAGSTWTSGRLTGLCLGLAAASGIVVAGVSGSSMLAAVAALVCGWAPVARLKTRRGSRRRAHREAWPDCIATLIAIIRSGGSIASACVELADRSPEQLRPAWLAFRSAYRASGSYDHALSSMTVIAADPIADRVGVVLRTVHDVGGSEIVPVLAALAGSVRADLRVLREVEARWSWTVTAARVAAAAPWIVLLLMATRPEAASAYTSPRGGFVLVGGAAATVIGYRTMLRAARLPSEGRLQS
jgi:tight adherence protein B